jgi:ankyrin repeat protein
MSDALSLFLNTFLSSYRVLGCHDQSNQTPLHEAADRGYDEIVRILLENKADANIRDKVH